MSQISMIHFQAIRVINISVSISFFIFIQCSLIQDAMYEMILFKASMSITTYCS